MEAKKEEKSTVSGNSSKEPAFSDIENVLDFLDSEEYQEVSQPGPHTKNAPKRQSIGKARHDTSKPLSSEIGSVKSLRQQNPPIKTTEAGKIPHQPQIEKRPTKRAAKPLEKPKEKKSGKIWLLWLGAATLIFLAIFLLYEHLL